MASNGTFEGEEEVGGRREGKARRIESEEKSLVLQLSSKLDARVYFSLYTEITVKVFFSLKRVFNLKKCLFKEKVVRRSVCVCV